MNAGQVLGLGCLLSSVLFTSAHSCNLKIDLTPDDAMDHRTVWNLGSYETKLRTLAYENRAVTVS